MAHALDEIVWLDRRWFWAHPERRHRCRWPEKGELDLCDSDCGARLIMALRHLGRGRVIYQPVIFQGALPADEKSAAALFALAATSPEPVPVITQMEVLRLRRGLRQQMQSHEASAMVTGSNGWNLVRNEPRLGQEPAGTGSGAPYDPGRAQADLAPRARLIPGKDALQC